MLNYTKIRLEYEDLIEKSSHNKETSILQNFGHCDPSIEISTKEIFQLFWRCLLKETCAHGYFLHIYTMEFKNSSPMFFNQLSCKTMNIKLNNLPKLKPIIMLS
jgi:hypothetical protein